MSVVDEPLKAGDVLRQRHDLSARVIAFEDRHSAAKLHKAVDNDGKADFLPVAGAAGKIGIAIHGLGSSRIQPLVDLWSCLVLVE